MHSGKKSNISDSKEGIYSERDLFSKAGRGRPEGPTERSVFKNFFVMMAIFRALLANLLEKKLVQIWPLARR